MQDHSALYLTFGCLFALGLLTNLLGQRTPLPRASLLMIAGILLGPWLLNLLPETADTWFDPIADIALVMIAFLLGEQLTLKSFRESGRAVTIISITVAFATALIVFAGLKLAGFSTEVALLLAGIEWPFMILFFTLAGASLDVGTLGAIGLLGTAYVIFRIAGRLAGGWIGGRLAGAEPRTRTWIGAAMMPQAGVAIGMALIALQRYPGEGQTILTTVIASTMLFEIGGPIVTRYVVVRVGENALSDEQS